MSSDVDPITIGAWLRDGKLALDFMKGALNLLPKGSERTKAIEQVEQAESALARSEAAAAKELGFALCQCTFPPQIMLWKEADRAHVCPNPACGHAIPRGMKITPETLSRASGPHSWMAR